MKLLQKFIFVPTLIGMAVIFVFASKNNKNIVLERKPIQAPKITAPINIIGQWAGEGDKEKFLKEFANEYEFLNQDIKVNLKFREEVYNPTDETQFIVDQLKKPTADWDIIVRAHVNYYPIASILKDPKWGEKYLVDFGKIPGFIESHKDFLRSDMYKKQYGGIFFGPYNEGQLCVLYVNTEVAKKMGITIKQYGMTFDDFLGYMKAAYAYNQSHSYIAPIFEDASWIQTEIIFKRLFFSLMGNFTNILDPKLTEKKLKALEKCYQACEELAKYKPIIRNRSKISFWHNYDYPLKDSCLFFSNYTFVYNFWKMKDKAQMTKMMPCELPVFKPTDTYMGGYVANWAVLKNAPHREEAIKLMMYWCKPNMAEKWVRYTKSPSGVKGNLTSSVFGVDQFESFMYTIGEKYGDKMVQELANQYIVGEKNYNPDYHVIDVLEGRLTAKNAFETLKMKMVF